MLNYKARDTIKRYIRDRIINFIVYKPWRKGIRFAIWEMGLSHFLNYLYYKYLEHRCFMAGGDRLNFEHEVCIAAIIKNEAPYICEWIEYHLLIGVEKFYIYNNESSDNIREVLKSYIDEGIVVFKDFAGKNVHGWAYMDAIKRYRNKTRWLALIDLDEFIVIKNGAKIADFLRDYEDYDQLLMGWQVYGSNGHKTKPQGLVIENYTRHAKEDFITNSKTVLNPRNVRGILNTHWRFMFGLSVDENKTIFRTYPYTNKYFKPISKNKICLNHYYGKSEEEFLKKSARGFSDGNTYKMTKDLFEFFDRNEIFDDALKKYVPLINAAIEKRKNLEK
ncbi:MAG: glycosyltransferase family 92 protein [Elusimicrobiota bacterium]|jgi:hypothetical protein|nr:glycosyltransferase family 92 protein [Elusimicrobiota bacterium]